MNEGLTTESQALFTCSGKIGGKLGRLPRLQRVAECQFVVLCRGRVHFHHFVVIQVRHLRGDVPCGALLGRAAPVRVGNAAMLKAV